MTERTWRGAYAHLWGTQRARGLRLRPPTRGRSTWSRNQWAPPNEPPRRWCWPPPLCSKAGWPDSAVSSAGSGFWSHRRPLTYPTGGLPPAPSPQSYCRWYCGPWWNKRDKKKCITWVWALLKWSKQILWLYCTVSHFKLLLRQFYWAKSRVSQPPEHKPA